MVMIGSARIDENGHATWGKAGDQTGKEVSTQEWYLHSKGWYVIRPKSEKVAEDIATAMEHACANNNIGYDQKERFTAYDWCKYNNGGNYDPAKISVKVETDCSALVRLCLAYAGIFVGDFYTANEYDVLMETGKFINATNPASRNPEHLRRGDILVTKVKGHTVVVLTNGSKIKEAKNVTDKEDFVEVKTMAKTFKLGTVELGSYGNHVLTVQRLLKGMGYKGPNGEDISGDKHAGPITMYGVKCYIEDMAKQGVNLGGVDGWGPLCWASMGWDVVE